MSRNVNASVEGNILTVTVDLSQSFGRTGGGTGKNIKVATSGGGRGIEVDGPDNREFAVSLNVYRRPEAGE